MKMEHPGADKRKLEEYYTRQNELIDQLLGAGSEEQNAAGENAYYKPRIKFAVHASFGVNIGLFCLQLYAAIATGSLAVSRRLGRFVRLMPQIVADIGASSSPRPPTLSYVDGLVRWG